MLVALLTLYLAVPIVVFVLCFIDVWAKSYDFPRAQRIAKGVLTGFVALTCAWSVLLASRALDAAGTGQEFWLVAAAEAFPLATLLWLIHHVHWSVYAAAAVGSPAAFFARPTPTIAQLLVAAGITAVVVALAMRRELHNVKLRRYARMLQHACSCCGFKQRAVHELSAMGSAGEERIRLFLDQPGSRHETRVRDEWNRCRPTMR
jgi:hypothetical protein